MLARLLVVSFITVLAVGVASCKDERTDDPPLDERGSSSPLPVPTKETNPTTVTYPPDGIPRQTSDMNDYNPFIADSLEQLTGFFDTIIVGKPLTVEAGFPYAAFFINHLQAPTCPAEPKCSDATPDPTRAGPLVSTYEVEVIDVLKSEDLKVGAVIPIRQEGGVLDGILRESEADPAIRIGPTYLLFLDFGADGAYAGSPFARFELDSSGLLHNVDPLYWSDLPAVRALEGMPLSQAVDAVEAVISDAPSPAEAAAEP
jgi:hypothetical protein